MTSLSTCGLPIHGLFTENIVYIQVSNQEIILMVITRKGMGFPTAVVTTLSKRTSRKNPDSYFGSYFLHIWKDTRLV